jgi:hypothetical protein
MIPICNNFQILQASITYRLHISRIIHGESPARTDLQGVYAFFSAYMRVENMPFYNHWWVEVNKPDILSPNIRLYALVLTTISSLQGLNCQRKASIWASILKAHGSVKLVSQAKIR